MKIKGNKNERENEMSIGIDRYERIVHQTLENTGFLAGDVDHALRNTGSGKLGDLITDDWEDDSTSDSALSCASGLIDMMNERE